MVLCSHRLSLFALLFLLKKLVVLTSAYILVPTVVINYILILWDFFMACEILKILSNTPLYLKVITSHVEVSWENGMSLKKS